MGLVRPKHLLVCWLFLEPQPSSICLHGSFGGPGDPYHSSCTGGPCLNSRQLQWGSLHGHTPARSLPPYTAAFPRPKATSHIALITCVCTGKFCLTCLGSAPVCTHTALPLLQMTRVYSIHPPAIRLPFQSEPWWAQS